MGRHAGVGGRGDLPREHEGAPLARVDVRGRSHLGGRARAAGLTADRPFRIADQRPVRGRALHAVLPEPRRGRYRELGEGLPSPRPTDRRSPTLSVTEPPRTRRDRFSLLDVAVAVAVAAAAAFWNASFHVVPTATGTWRGMTDAPSV